MVVCYQGMKTMMKKRLTRGVCVINFLQLLFGCSFMSGNLQAACNAPDGSDYSIDLTVTHDSAYPADKDASLAVVVNGYSGGSQPVHLTWSGISEGSADVNFGVTTMISLPALAMACSAVVKDKQLKFKVTNSPDNHPGKNDCWAETNVFFTAVAIDRMQFKWGAMAWADVGETNYVPVNTNVDFLAVKKPAGADWPSGKAAWEGATSLAPDTSVAAKTFDTPGFFDVTAECGNAVTAKMCVIKVESVKPDNIEREIDDGDGNPNTRTFVVNMTTNVGNLVTVTAKPTPNIAEANLPSCWVFEVTEGSANESGKLVRKIDRTRPSKTVLRGVCGNEKITTVYVVRCIYSGFSDNSGVVGHGWWHLGIEPASAVEGVLGKISPPYTWMVNSDGGFFPIHIG
jgi:hypothetical protein